MLFFSSVIVYGQNGTIETISLGPQQNKYNIFVKGSGRLEYTEVLFQNPPRIALDFANIKNKFNTRTFEPKENPFVRIIRTMEYYKAGSKISRVMVELKEPLVHKVSRAGEGLTLELMPPQTSDQAPTTSAVVTDAKPAGENPGPEVSTPPTTTSSPPTTTSSPPTTQEEKPVAPVQQPAPQQVPENLDILIGSEDLLEISVFELPQFSVSSRVAGDGTITMPLIGSIEVRGLTKKQVEEKIAAALEAKYVNNANVSVTIKEYKSRQVSVLGAIRNPGAYYIVSPRTLLQLISEAGGLTPEAGKKCYIFRHGASRVDIDLLDLMNNGNQDLNVPILPGDVVNIPAEAKIIIYVLGAVKAPGAVEMTTSMPITLLAAIARAGGPTEQANKSNIQIRRKDAGGRETVLKANLKDIIKGKTSDVKLMPGDVINVPESFF